MVQFFVGEVNAILNIFGLVLFEGVLQPWQSFIGIIVFSSTLVFINQVFIKKFTNQEEIKKINKQLANIKSRLKSTSKTSKTSKSTGLNSEFLSLTNKKFFMISKPLLFTAPIFLILFPLMSGLFNGFRLIVFDSSFPLIGNDVGWFLTYILLSIPVSILIRKVISVET